MEYQQGWREAEQLMAAGEHRKAAAIWLQLAEEHDDGGNAFSNFCFCLAADERWLDTLKAFVDFLPKHRSLKQFNIDFLKNAFLKVDVRKGLNAMSLRDFEVGFNCEQIGERELIERLAPTQPSIVFDVGANVGKWTSLALEYFPQTHVHAFEIVPATFEKLRETHGENEAVTLNDQGLSEEAGELTVYTTALSNTLSSIFPYWKDTQEVRARVIRGDDYLEAKRIAKIDLLKIDVEGAEFLVLRGFEQAIKQGRIRAIQFEYGQANILSHHLLYDINQFLQQSGYVFGKLDSQGAVDFQPYEYWHEDFMGPNYVAIRERDEELAALLKA